MHAEQRRARLDLVGWATSDGAAHVLGAIPPQWVTEEEKEKKEREKKASRVAESFFSFIWVPPIL